MDLVKRVPRAGDGRVLRRLALAGILASAYLAAGCAGAGSGLATTCGEYVTKDHTTQVQLAGEWADPVRDGRTSAEDKMVAPTYRDRLVAYCSDSDHRDDELRDLDLTYGVG